MELSPYIKDLQDALATVAAPGGKDVATAAALLTDALESSARLSLIGAMTDAADEITSNLDDLTVEVRLRGREVEFVVSEPSHPPEAPVPPGHAQPDSSDDVARIPLRLPESLKDSVEHAAYAENISVNAWLVRAIADVVDGDVASHRPSGRRGRGRRYTGFARA